MPDLSSAGLPANTVVFLAAAAAILFGGTRLAAFGDKLADRLRWGEAVTGTLFLGFATALPGLAASVTAALDGHPALAIGNAVGGIAHQTVFLAVADLVYRKANLEHAATSVANMIQTAVLIALLTLLVLGLAGPDRTLGHVHPVSLILLVVAAAGFWLVYRSKTKPMWRPRITSDTVEDKPDQKNIHLDLGKLLGGFFVTAAFVTLAGAIVAHTTGNIADQTGWSETVVGTILSGFATSLPELVTTIAAVRRGALTLAVSDIVGGNFFDVLFVLAADLVYLKGSLFHADGVGYREMFLVGFTIALNVVFLIGLLYRQRQGPGHIGFESVLMLLTYVFGFTILIAGM